MCHPVSSVRIDARHRWTFALENETGGKSPILDTRLGPFDDGAGVLCAESC